jgi:choline dehydrogenase-like flavoprotein
MCAVGEMFPNPANAVVLAEPDEYGVPRASVNLTRAGTQTLMTAMDQAIDNVALNVFGRTTNAAAVTPDGLGTTFHESGTLRMGDAPNRSVVNPDSQFHYITNLYAGDASVLPTCGSSNPVMNGLAIRRRLAKRLVPEGEGDLPPPGSPTGPPCSRRRCRRHRPRRAASFRCSTAAR